MKGEIEMTVRDFIMACQHSSTRFVLTHDSGKPFANETAWNLLNMNDYLDLKVGSFLLTDTKSIILFVQ